MTTPPAPGPAGDPPASPASAPAGPPPVSPDGKLWWNGQEWVPFPKAAADRRMPGQTLPTPVIAMAVVFFTLFALWFLANLFGG